MISWQQWYSSLMIISFLQALSKHNLFILLQNHQSSAIGAPTSSAWRSSSCWTVPTPWSSEESTSTPRSRRESVWSSLATTSGYSSIKNEPRRDTEELYRLQQLLVESQKMPAYLYKYQKKRSSFKDVFHSSEGTLFVWLVPSDAVF